MKLHVLSFFLFFSLFQILSAQNRNDSGFNGDEFDFWVGTWDATWDEGEGVVGKGTNSIQKIMDKKVILENFEILEGASKGFKGTSISVLSIQSATWKQAWADSQGSYLDFEGFVNDNTRGFKTQTVNSKGQKMIARMVFKDIEEDAFTWDWESSLDGGKTWSLLWRVNYTRKL
ncbi:MAG: hypothetical protein AAGL34_14990 [Bacteroidota bacterium]